MSETRDNAYKDIIESGYLSRTQQFVYNVIWNNEYITRQKISEITGYNINVVCGRVKELLEMGYIIADGQKNNQELLRLKRSGEETQKLRCLTPKKFSNAKSNIIRYMNNANQFQRKQLKKLVDSYFE